MWPVMKAQAREITRSYVRTGENTIIFRHFSQTSSIVHCQSQKKKTNKKEKICPNFFHSKTIHSKCNENFEQTIKQMNPTRSSFHFISMHFLCLIRFDPKFTFTAMVLGLERRSAFEHTQFCSLQSNFTRWQSTLALFECTHKRR